MEEYFCNPAENPKTLSEVKFGMGLICRRKVAYKEAMKKGMSYEEFVVEWNNLVKNN